MAASAGVGAKWTPTRYKKKAPPPPRPPSGMPDIPTIGAGGFGSAGGGGAGGAAAGAGAGAGEMNSIEQVMKANALQRKNDMEQRYLNAGERPPQNTDEYG
eukprot:450522_1